MPTEIILTNGQTLILILCAIGVLTLVDFTLFYAYNKVYEIYFGEPIKCVELYSNEYEESIGARIRTLNRSSKTIKG
jgi:hypothetical protein